MKTVNMVYTDPPYGMKLDTDYSSIKQNSSFSEEKGLTGGRKYGNVLGDHEDFNPQLITSVLENFYYCKEIFLFGGDYFAELIPNKNDGSWIVWDKRLDESADKMYGSCFELCWSKTKHKRHIARIKWAFIFGVEQEFDRIRHHPTQKPILLAKWFFEQFGNEGDTVADLYGGSGSTLIACEQTNRQCYMMELEPKYIDVIIKRWETLTGQKAVKVSEQT
jgi:site-specific DNA-methyltransferase (adenine-specific)